MTDYPKFHQLDEFYWDNIQWTTKAKICLNLFWPDIAFNKLVISTHEAGYKLANQSTKLTYKIDKVHYS